MAIEINCLRIICSLLNLSNGIEPTSTGFGQFRGHDHAVARKNRLPREPKMIEANG
jgi:hypothetical protein